MSGDRLRREIEKLFDDAARDLDPALALRCLEEWHVLAALEPGLGLLRESIAPIRRLGRALATPPWRRAALPGLGVRARGLARAAAAGPSGWRRSSGSRCAASWWHASAPFPRRCFALLEPLSAARGRGVVDSLLASVDEEELHALYAWRHRLGAPADRPLGRRGPHPPAARERQRSARDIGVSGPAVGRALARIRRAFLDGAVANREEALALAREVSRQPAPRASRRRKSRSS